MKWPNLKTGKNMHQQEKSWQHWLLDLPYWCKTKKVLQSLKLFIISAVKMHNFLLKKFLRFYPLLLPYFLQTEGIRLPGHLLPEKYRIELVPFIIPDNFTIRGKVVINMNCVSPGNNVTLHYADMDLDKKSILVSISQIT